MRYMVYSQYTYLYFVRIIHKYDTIIICHIQARLWFLHSPVYATVHFEARTTSELCIIIYSLRRTCNTCNVHQTL